MPLSVFATALAASPPWFSPYLTFAQRIAGAGTSSVANALNDVCTSDYPVSFVDHSMLPAEEAYETFIFRTRCVPTRDNLHDLLNGMVWLRFPQTKRRLNALQAEAIERHGVGTARGALRDALTVFDENAALLQAPPPLVASLRARDWQSVFVTQRAEWQATRIVLFGHALLEKLMTPRKAITAHAWVVETLDDASIAAGIDSESCTTKSFLPMPVLGIPGWWAANEDPTFYDDGDVFRKPRSR